MRLISEHTEAHVLVRLLSLLFLLLLGSGGSGTTSSGTSSTSSTSGGSARLANVAQERLQVLTLKSLGKDVGPGGIDGDTSGLGQSLELVGLSWGRETRMSVHIIYTL